MTAPLPEPQEQVLSLAPLTVRRRVRWSECDPAGVVYAGKFPDYMITAVGQLRAHVLNAPLAQAGVPSFNTPGKALSMVFLSPLWPDDVFDMSVYLGGIGRSTVHFLVAATRADTGLPVFAGRLSSIYVEPGNRLKVTPVPEPHRATLDAYAGQCPAHPDFLNHLDFAV